jgi:hypothetical protein
MAFFKGRAKPGHGPTHFCHFHIFFYTPLLLAVSCEKLISDASRSFCMSNVGKAAAIGSQILHAW